MPGDTLSSGGAWFIYNDSDAGKLVGSEILAGLSSLDEMRHNERHEMAGDESLEVGKVVRNGEL